MVCQLTFTTVLLALVVIPAIGQTASPGQPQRGSPPTRLSTHTVHWENVRLQDAIARVRALQEIATFVDRRADPGQRIDLSESQATAEELVEMLAHAAALESCRIENLIYLGPPQVAQRLDTLASDRRQEVNSVGDAISSSMMRRQRIAWPRLAEPRGLVSQLLHEHGWRVDHVERIPHDLWPAGELPSMPLTDQITLLLAGFDLTFQISDDHRTIEIVPVDWDRIARRSSRSMARPRSRSPRNAGIQVVTLRVESQPVGRVLDQLRRKLGWQLEIDESALHAAGRSLDEPVSFSVENADTDELLEALLRPAGLTFERNENRVRIIPN